MDHGCFLKMAPVGLTNRFDEGHERREDIDDSKISFLEQLEVWGYHSLT